MRIPETLRPLFQAFSDLNRLAYHHPALQANYVLRKTPPAGETLLPPEQTDPSTLPGQSHASPHRVSRRMLVRSVFAYYAINSIYFCLLLCKKAAHALAGVREVPFSPTASALPARPVIIDSFVVVDATVANRHWRDTYFPGLAPALESHGYQPVLMPRFYGSHNPLALFRTLRILRTQGIPLVTEYGLLTFGDYLRILGLMLSMPVLLLRVLRQASQTPHPHTDSAYARAVRHRDYLLIRGLASGHLAPMVRRVAARRLGTHLPPHAKTISWFENQSIDACFMAGLHETAPTVTRYGAQLLLWADSLLNAHADDTDIPFGLAPDVPMATGPYFFPADSTQEYRTGPALRYAYLFGPDSIVRRNPQGPILVLLSYHHEETVRILTAVQQLTASRTAFSSAPASSGSSGIPGSPGSLGSRNAPDTPGAPFSAARPAFRFRFHPATRPEHYASLLPADVHLSQGSMHDALREASLVVGSGTGALAEAVACGIPAINITEAGRLCHCFLPPFGKGLLWDTCDVSASLSDVRDRLEAAQHPLSPDALRGHSRTFRDLLFQEPTPRAIANAFDL